MKARNVKFHIYVKKKSEPVINMSHISFLGCKTYIKFVRSPLSTGLKYITLLQSFHVYGYLGYTNINKSFQRKISFVQMFMHSSQKYNSAGVLVPDLHLRQLK